MDKVDATMASVAEQRELANEIADAISQPVDQLGDAVRLSRLLPQPKATLLTPLQQDDLQAELDDLEQEQLNLRLSEADHVPVHIPPSAVTDRAYIIRDGIRINPDALIFHLARHHERVAVEDDEEAQLKELQAALAM